MKQVVITGVSTGIGHACVKVLTNRGFRVFGVKGGIAVRAQDLLELRNPTLRLA